MTEARGGVLVSVVTLALALLGGGCSPYAVQARAEAPVDPRAPVPQGLAEVCVVRPGAFGLLGTHVVHDNGALAGATRGRGWFCYRTAPGPHRVSSELGASRAEVTLDLRAGQRAFLEQSATMEGIALAPLPEARALAEMAGLSYVEIVAAPADERAPRPGEAVIGSALEPPPPPPPRPPRSASRWPEGYVMGLSAGAGAGFARTALAGDRAPYDRGAAAAAAYTVSLTDGNVLQIGIGIDVLTAAGHDALGASLHTVVFPAWWRRGPVADFNLFLDFGGAGRTGATPPGAKNTGLFQGTIGVGWDGWHVGRLAAGPFLAGTVGHGDENLAMVLAGVGARLYLGERGVKRAP